jgi:tRNA(adenine34) deaminase
VSRTVKDDAYWMGKALAEARKAGVRGEVPIGAVLVRDGAIIGRGFNQREARQDPVAHAELLAIRQAARRLKAWRLTGATLYVTLEPCPMCMGAILLARIERLVFGCYDPKAGAAGSLYDLTNDRRFNHRVAVTAGVREAECSAELSAFFRELRRRKKGEGGALALAAAPGEAAGKPTIEFLSGMGYKAKA